ncbi:FAD/NAD(P)-binding domain-containing protein [Xylaria bambusicola]|uniref:FAD/NAD(P)-binding domain-containing protein n=1 Tax=Xylaria bambusicola TaxID=326684 RepID=UPI002008E379|nr:FAD/NAD(P)-binding domain-containing protein [Xylaria bambusicola]KAI0505219.1 FAD/NAD(P)-binding domain-containing protein [Xylaria bambusicola]
MTLKILIIGAGVCGPAFATLLRRADPSLSKYEITIVERAEKLRETGLQIDLRSHGIPVARKMGLLEAIRHRAVPEQGVAFVDSTGKPYAKFGKNDSGHGRQAFSSEYEIMRGDLVDVFYRASLGLSPEGEGEDEAPAVSGVVTNGNVRYEFGTTITSLSQHSAEKVSATFSTGRTDEYDLVVGADGQSSRTRRMLLGSQEASDACFKSLDLLSALYLVPRSAQDNAWMNVHLMSGRRGLFTRSADTKAATTQVYMAVSTSRSEDKYGVCTAVREKSPAEQRAVFARAYADQHGWRTDEFVRALTRETPLEDFYATEIGQVRCARLAVGRVVLLGDAGYCPSPITGMGTTLSLVGAYILAGELARHGSSDGVPAALQSYARGVRPYVDEAQRLPPGLPGLLYAETSWGLWILTTVLSVIAKSRIADVLVRLMPETSSRDQIPEYPELNLGNEK